MKLKTNRILSTFISMLMVFMCMTSANVQATAQKMTFKFNKIEVSAGQDIQFDIIITNPMAIKEINNVIINVPDGFTVTGMSETSPAFNGTVTHSVNGNYLNFSIASNGTLGSSDIATSIYMHVDENCEAKNYMFQWISNAVSCTLASGSSYTPQFTFGIITVGTGGSIQTTTTTSATTTTTTETETTTTTNITYEPYAKISINNLPSKTEYITGEQIDLTGLTISYDYYYGENTHEAVYSNVSPLDYTDAFIVDTSAFNAYQSGTYEIKIMCTDDLSRKYWYATAVSFEVTVKEPETTATTTTTESTTTTTTAKYSYSVHFVDEETNQAVSGVRYNIVSYYAFDPAHVVQTSSENARSFEFISDAVYVALANENALPNGYSTSDGAERWELSANNPYLTVYLRKSATLSLGDVNNDGLVNSVDASLVLAEYALLSTNDHTGTFTAEQNTIGDLNKDGKLDASDATLIAMYYAYLSTDIIVGTPKDTIDIWLSYTVIE